MFSIYDADCPICKGLKQLKITNQEKQSDLGYMEFIRYWDYALSEDEVVIEVFCAECGVKFVYPY